MNKIGWCDVTWSPVTGCKPDYPCWERCWARRMANRLKGRYGYDRDEPFRPTCHPDKLDEPLHWKKPRVIFAISMGDLLADGVPNEWIAPVLDVVCDARCEQHTFVLLTKRPDRWPHFLEWASEHWGNSPLDVMLEVKGHIPNLVIGTSVSTQAEWDERVPLLCTIPAWKRIVSVEPMLGAIDMRQVLGLEWCGAAGWIRNREAVLSGYEVPVHGVICGGESGPGARPMDLRWARDLRDQCKAAGVCFYMKQIDKKTPIPEDLMIRELPFAVQR